MQTLSSALQLPSTQVSLGVQPVPSASQPVPTGALFHSHAPLVGSQASVLQVVLPTVGQLTIVAGLTLQVLDDKSQYSLPLQALPSSLPAQSLSNVHSQVTVPPVHSPLAHDSPLVQVLASSHSPVWSTSPQMPLLGSQVLSRHSVSCAVGQTTTVAGFNSHCPLDLLQNRVPLQALPSSWLSQSLSLVHRQVLVPGLQLPLLQASPAVQVLPSLHGKPSLTAVMVQAPVSWMQVFWLQAVSALVSQTTTELGATWHWPVPRLQNNLPLQRLPSSNAAQSAVLLQAQTTSPLWQVPF
jgi:hypothetical protein